MRERMGHRRSFVGVLLCLMQVMHRLRSVAAQAIVMDQLVEMIVEAVGVQFLDCLGGFAVDRFAPFLQY